MTAADYGRHTLSCVAGGLRCRPGRPCTEMAADWPTRTTQHLSHQTPTQGDSQ